MYKKTIFWFRQDLRVHDNIGFSEALKQSEQILPIFILDTNIIDSFGGLKDQKFGFIREALEKLSENIHKLGAEKIIVLQGKPEEIIPTLVEKYDIECIYTNKSYGTYGIKRDSLVAQNSNSDFKSYKDFFIFEPHEVEQRKVFTPFYKIWRRQLEANPFHASIHEAVGNRTITQIKTEEQSEAADFIEIEKHPYFSMQFGEERLSKLPVGHYNDVRNNLDKDGTSRLSPYLRFGIFSIREIFQKVSNNSVGIPLKGTHEESYISELAWREFWWHIYHYFPHTKELEFQEKRRHITWSRDEIVFKKWCNGETGYPIVDAAMKQLNETNWMHGRARMIVANFHTKDLHIDWRLGEQYFKEKLLDYDEAVNLGNWQWGASVGADPKPLRIFSPLLQSAKFDPEATYIRKYIPELQYIPPKHIHDPITNSLDYTSLLVNHKDEQAKAKAIYKQSTLDFEDKKIAI